MLVILSFLGVARASGDATQTNLTDSNLAPPSQAAHQAKSKQRQGCRLRHPPHSVEVDAVAAGILAGVRGRESDIISGLVMAPENERVAIEGVRFVVARWGEVFKREQPEMINIQNPVEVLVLVEFLERETGKIRIDELPQLINVLSGSICIVGPRPERPEFVKQLLETVPYYAERHCLKPGLTGWPQLRYNYGSSEEDAIRSLLPEEQQFAARSGDHAANRRGHTLGQGRTLISVV